MHHRQSRLRLGKKQDVAWQMQRNLVTSILLYEKIRTTRKNARVVQPMIDRLITDAKKKTPTLAIRSINRIVTDKNASRKLMEVLKDRYANRPSGFTKIVIAGARKGDGAELVDLMLIDRAVAQVTEKEEKKAAKKTTKKTATAAA